MWAKARAAALVILATVCSISWAESSSPKDGHRPIFSGSQALAPDLDFYTLGPCRAVDTRAGAPLTSGAPTTFQIAGTCGVPVTAKALAIQVTVVGPTAQGYVKLWPADRPEPATSTISFGPAIRANNAIATLATDGSGGISAKAFLADAGSVHLIIDVTGYLAGDPAPQCQCPIPGVPLSLIFAINPSSGGVGSTVTVSGQSFVSNVQVLFGDSETGSLAQIVSRSSTSITGRVPAPSSSFTFSTEPCDGDGDGIFEGTRNVPTPVSVNARSLDGNGCVATLSNAFTLVPPDTACTTSSAELGSHPIREGTGSPAGAPVTQCQCPTHGLPLPQILGVDPPAGIIGSTVTISGESFASNVHVLFGDPATGSAAQIVSTSSTSITARVPPPPPGFTFLTEPCDGNGDGIPGGTRNAPAPITVSVRSLDGTGCVTTLDNVFTLSPHNTTCTGDNSTPP